MGHLQSHCGGVLNHSVGIDECQSVYCIVLCIDIYLLRFLLWCLKS